jgi:hypothetical protein
MQDSPPIDPTVISDLQDLVVDNPDLEKLESLLDQFNIFEAIGAVRQEVRHSDFLAFLLNPRQNHGLGDIFTKRLLQKAISQSVVQIPVTPIDLDIWDLNEIEVRREWQSIDILLLDEEHQFAVIIENKVYTGEHHDQLKRYRDIVRQHYPNYRLLGLFLTPEGEPPKDGEYIPISYMLICNLVESLAAARATILGQDVLTLMNHYTSMLRRNIVGESEIEQLCHRIYKKHKKALDLIYEYRPDQQAEIGEYVKELVNADSRFKIDHSSKSSVLFLPENWDFPVLRNGQGWTPSGRMLLFQFINQQNLLRLYLYIGPGPIEIRQRFWAMVIEHEPPFKRAYNALGKMWSSFYSRTILSSSAYQNKTTEELKAEINHRWQEFLEHEYPRIDSIIMNEAWLQET